MGDFLIMVLVDIGGSCLTLLQFDKTFSSTCKVQFGFDRFRAFLQGDVAPQDYNVTDFWLDNSLQ
jgi:hypothetical protein